MSHRRLGWAGLVFFLFLSGCATFDTPEETVEGPFKLTEPNYKILEMRAAVLSSRREYITAPDGVAIPVRIFGEYNQKTPILYLHGLESHSGWFVQSAHMLAQHGYPVYGIDRRGSGVSFEKRGDCKDFREMLDDIHTIAQKAMAEHHSKNVHLIGNCFGSLPATAFAAEYPSMVKSLVVSSPSFYTRVSLDTMQKLGILMPMKQSIHSPLSNEMFTDLEDYLNFIEDDPLAVRMHTSSFYRQIPALKSFIHNRLADFCIPTFAAMAQNDPIGDNIRNQEFLDQLTRSGYELEIYPRAKHIIEFSPDKETYFKDLRKWFDGQDKKL